MSDYWSQFLDIHTGVESVDTVIDKVVLVVLILAAIFGGTKLFTECRYWYQSRGSAGRFQDREPLTLPYSIPWAGSAFKMMSPHGVYNYAKQRSVDGRPVKLRVGPIGIYILTGSKSVRSIFNLRNSKSLSRNGAQEMLLANSRMKPEDLKIFVRDSSGTGAMPSIDIPDEQRLRKNYHVAAVNHLATQASTNKLTTSFLDGLNRELDTQPKGREFTAHFYKYFRSAMLNASTEAILGSQILKLNPDFADAFWGYDDVFLLMAVGTPKILYGKGHAALDRFLNCARKWIDSAWENFDEKDRDSEWEPHFGSRYIREVVFSLKAAGLSNDGQAVAMLALIWAVSSNSMPGASWAMLEILQRPKIHERVREEVSKVATTDESGNVKIDLPRLLSECPLLNSIYMEVLRTRASSTATRKISEDIECDGYILKAGNHIMIPSWVPAQDTALWSVPGHPAQFFWAERFLEMPKIKSENPDEKSRYEQAMRPENWFPYGGGSTVCPGRFLAKGEIMASVALALLKFDIKPMVWFDHGGKLSFQPAMPDESSGGSGILKPDRDLKVKMTRIK